METEFKPGDRIRIIRDGGNNSSALEHDSAKSLKGSITIHTVERVETKGVYTSRDGSSHTLILTTGQPIWSGNCELAERIINNYPIY